MSLLETIREQLATVERLEVACLDAAGLTYDLHLRAILTEASAAISRGRELLVHAESKAAALDRRSPGRPE